MSEFGQSSSPEEPKKKGFSLKRWWDHKSEARRAGRGDMRSRLEQQRLGGLVTASQVKHTYDNSRSPEGPPLGEIDMFEIEELIDTDYRFDLLDATLLAGQARIREPYKDVNPALAPEVYNRYNQFLTKR